MGLIKNECLVHISQSNKRNGTDGKRVKHHYQNAVELKKPGAVTINPIDTAANSHCAHLSTSPLILPGLPNISACSPSTKSEASKQGKIKKDGFNGLALGSLAKS